MSAFIAEVRLGTANVATESRDDFVEHERAPGVFGDAADFLQPFARLQIRASAMHGFDQQGGEFVGVGAEQFQARGRAVIQHQHVAHDVLGDAGRDGQGTALAVGDGGAHEHLVVDAVEPAAGGDAGASGDRARERARRPGSPRNRCS